MEIKYKDIENKIFVIPDLSIPITYVSIIFLIGNYLENPNNLGINNLCFKTLIRSTKTMDYESLQYYLEKNSVSISSSVGNFSSAISISFPYYNYKKAIEILKEVLFNYSFRNEDISEVKRDFLNSIKLSRDDVWTYLYENADSAFYNSFLSWDTRGNKQTLKNIQRKNLIKWLENKIFDKKIKKIMVISGYTSPTFENQIYKTFSKFLNNENLYFEKMNNFDVIKTKKIKKLGKKEVGICLIYEAPNLSENSIKFKVLNGILSSMSGRLFINIREKKELAYAITSIYDPIPFGKGNIKIMMLTNKEKKQKALHSLREEINDILQKGFTQEELDISKNYITGLFSSAMQKRSFKNALLAKIKAYNLPDSYLFDHLKIIKETTLEEINSLSKIFQTKESTFIVV